MASASGGEVRLRILEALLESAALSSGQHGPWAAASRAS